MAIIRTRGNSHQLIETYREDGKVKQRILGNLGPHELQAFVEVTTALLEIRDRRLYKQAGHDTFEEYCQKRWGWGPIEINNCIEVFRAMRVNVVDDTTPAISRPTSADVHGDCDDTTTEDAAPCAP